MRVLVVGASGAIGTRLVQQLTDRGHTVIGTSRSPESGARIERAGGQAITLDLLDPSAVRKAVFETAPEAVVHEATALGEAKFTRNFDRIFAGTNALRTDGTDALIAAAQEAGVERIVAQSYASARYERTGGWVKDETAPLDPTPPKEARRSHAAMRHVDQAVVDAGGAVLRYGAFYGAANDGLREPVRKRQLPLVGAGSGHTSFIHLDDAAAATVLVVEQGATGIYHIVDDDPAPLSAWLPVMAEAVGAKSPRHVPTWLARLLGGETAVVMATSGRAASNAKAKRDLGWVLRYPSWRQGFFAAYSA